MRILFIFLLLNNTILAQSTINQYHLKFKTKNVSVKKNSFDFLKIRESMDDVDNIKYLYRLHKSNDTILFIRHYHNIDSCIFLGKKQPIKGDKFYVIKDASIRLDINRHIYQVKFKNEKYIVFESSLMGAPGKGANYSVLLILNKKNNGKMICAVANNFQTNHFVDYENDGSLDFVYENWKNEIVRVNLTTEIITKLK